VDAHFELEFAQALLRSVIKFDRSSVTRLSLKVVLGIIETALLRTLERMMASRLI